MRRLLVVAGALVCAVAAIAAAQARSTASLRLLRSQPLVVGGTGFRSLERVRVNMVVHEGTYARRVVATRAGGFTVTFAGVPISRCYGYKVVAIGNRGSRTALKQQPLPACLPQ